MDSQPRPTAALAPREAVPYELGKPHPLTADNIPNFWNNSTLETTLTYTADVSFEAAWASPGDALAVETAVNDADKVEAHLDFAALTANLPPPPLDLPAPFVYMP